MQSRVTDEAGGPAGAGRRARFGLVEADALSTTAWLHRLLRDVERRREGRQTVRLATSVNGATVSRAHRNPGFRANVSQFDYVDVDGMSLVYWSRLCVGPRVPERVSTTDFVHAAAATSAAHGVSFFLLGATEEVNRRAAARLVECYPELRIAGRQHGYFEDEERVISAINESRADVVWVAMGVPREQAFILRHRDRFTHAAWVKSCGGCFDFLSGRVRRAPPWVQNLGLEWGFRVLEEPRRLFWRYATTNPHSVMVMLRQLWRERMAAGGAAGLRRR